MLTIPDLRQQNLILFEAVSGSQAYNLATTHSDRDIRGVFIAPQPMFFGFSQVEQVSDATNDTQFFEIEKFLRLVLKNNPGALELLYTPDECVIYEGELFKSIRQHNFLSKLCLNTFGRYALGQIAQARGLNKKILNPSPKERKTVLDFCYVTNARGTEPVLKWLARNRYRQELCGLAKLPSFKDAYVVYYDPEGTFRGILGSQEADDVRVSSIPKEYPPLTYLYFNKDAYRTHCAQHKEYWAWVEKRNEARFSSTLSHGKRYDAKNMMHVFRILRIAEVIAERGTIDLRDHDRKFLLQVRSGSFEYEELVERAEVMRERLEELFQSSSLPEQPDAQLIEQLLIQIRHNFYSHLF